MGPRPVGTSTYSADGRGPHATLGQCGTTARIDGTHIDPLGDDGAAFVRVQLPADMIAMMAKAPRRA